MMNSTMIKARLALSTRSQELAENYARELDNLGFSIVQVAPRGVNFEGTLEGDNMPSTQQNKGWGIFSGTSAAAPQTVGVVALLLSVNPNLTPNQIRAVLSDTAADVTRGMSGLGDTTQIGYDEATGAGFVNAFRACLCAENLVTG